MIAFLSDEAFLWISVPGLLASALLIAARMLVVEMAEPGQWDNLLSAKDYIALVKERGED